MKYEFWTVVDESRSDDHSNTTLHMAPRTRVKEDARKDAEQGSSGGGTGDVESSFAELAQAHWLKPSKKKATKVKVKPDVLKNEIWDVLEKGDFAFKSLLVLENLQILERYDILLGLFCRY